MKKVNIKMVSCEKQYSLLQHEKCNEWLRPLNAKECGKTVFANIHNHEVFTKCPKCSEEFKIRKEKLPFFQ